MGDVTNPKPAVQWVGDEAGCVRLLDQTLLPLEERMIDCRTAEQVWEAIKALRVRGAPAIGVAAAYGVVVGCQPVVRQPRNEFDAGLRRVLDYLATSRPTAVNLFWALDRMRRVAAEDGAGLDSPALLRRLLQEARAIEDEDRAMCAAIGEYGAPLLAGCRGVLTHCNTGGLATAGDGTALAVIFAAARINPDLEVYADETRPLLQGARLTMWELMQRGVLATLICDSMAGWVMKHGRVQAAIVGADRIAANGDAANKIGTYGVSVLAKAHGLPFYVAAPSSTFDLTLSSGEQIPIEERAGVEITQGFGKQTAPTGCRVFNPAFDVAPAENITALITERGVIQPVTESEIRRVLGR
ncbi:MAG TPA: S-methyl-5-thioribose-1-phosphate isomerase [Planctomycetaceae bacterium]|nr:S-methyl-5-thioribose-1-phosphate isomerase [Planctomycetaceae bacterium]